MTTPRSLKIGLLLVGLVGLSVLAYWMGEFVYEGRNQGKDMMSQSRFAQLELALHIYHDEHWAFPPTKYQPVADGPIHSWRVLLVPHTSGDKRYSEYDFSQEWNSTNNLQALRGWEAPNRRIMPSRFFRMGGEGDGDIAHYLAIGDDEIWPSRRPLKSLMVKKGKDRFLIIEHPDSQIHWMEPKY